MRTGKRAAQIAALVVLAGVVATVALLGGPQARASSYPGRVTILTTAPATAPPTSASPGSTNSPAPATTAPPASAAPTTRPATPTTAHPATAPTPAPAPVSPVTKVTATTVPPTTVPATTTTIVGIGNQLPASPVTLPLQTTGSNGHVNPAFAWMSGIGFAVALLIVAGRLFVTRPGGKDRAPLT